MPQTMPPQSGSADTLAPKANTAPGEASAQTFVIGAGTEPERHVSDPSIRPFQFRAADEELADLRRRILATRWPSIGEGTCTGRLSR